MPTVYVPHKPDDTYQFSAAQKFGTIKILFEGRQNVVNAPGLPELVDDMMSNFGPDDYILVGGNRMILLLAFRSALRRNGKVKVLVYGSRSEAYKEQEIKA